MGTKNILLAGVGGQGLVLTTQLISEAALQAGFEVKTNDVVGLAQRGGKVWGNIRYGQKVDSPNIPLGEGDILLVLEPLEGKRWAHVLRERATIIMNTNPLPPSLVLMEKEIYPGAIVEEMQQMFNLVTIDAITEAKKLGNPKIANTFLVGIMAKHLDDIPKEIWLTTIRENVPPKSVELNEQAFAIGYQW